jgi:hypothetical protein
MHRATVTTVCRTSVVLVFLVALALAGSGGWSSLGPALGLVAVWAAPLAVRRAVIAEGLTPEGLVEAPAR